MTTGEILDRTFNQYRQNFQLFVAIGMVPAMMWFISNAFFLLMAKLQPRSHAGFSRNAVMLSGATLLIGFTIYLCGAAISHGAISYAVSAIHLGRSTGFSESYRRVRGKFLRILNVAISVFIRIFGTCLLIILGVASFTLIPGMRGNAAAGALIAILFFLAMIASVWLMARMAARYAFSVAACVLEDLPARAAIKRSVVLSKGSVGRILAIYILFTLVNGAFAFAISLPFQIAVVSAKSEVARVVLALGNNLASSVLAAVVGPLVTIAITLMYYDERVRKEAFDLNYMMEMLDGPASQPSKSAAASSGPLTA